MIHPPAHIINIQEIVGFCARALSALEGDVRPSENLAEGCEADEMALIFNNLAAEYPEAGAVYWGCRAWLLWMWQPVYLGVWAASVRSVSPDFSGFRHRMDGLFTARYRIAAQDLPVSDKREAVFQTASHLKMWMSDNLPLIQPHYPLGGKLAGYSLGDAVLKALSAAYGFGLLPRGEVARLEQWWRQALDVRCSGALAWDEEAQDFRVELAACCQHYRRTNEGYCAGCPKTRQKCRCAQ